MVFREFILRSLTFLFCLVWSHLCPFLYMTHQISLCLSSLFLSLCLFLFLSPSPEQDTQIVALNNKSESSAILLFSCYLPSVVTCPDKALLVLEYSVQTFWVVFQIQVHLETS